MSFGKFLKQLRVNNNLSLRELADKSNLSFSYINKLEKSINNPSREVVINIANAINYPVDNLLIKAGFLPDLSADKIIDNPELLNDIKDITGKKDVLIDGEFLKNIIKDYYAGELIKKKSIPIISFINKKGDFYKNKIGEITVDNGNEANFAVVIEDNSMEWIGLKKDDIVLFKKNNEPSLGDIIAFRFKDKENKIYIRYYIKENENIFLRAASPSLSDIELSKNIEILGQVIYQFNKPLEFNFYELLLIANNKTDDKWLNIVNKAKKKGLNPEKIEQLIDIL